jgi:hypothetical protein
MPNAGSARLPSGGSQVADVREVFRADDANTVGHRKVNKLTADIVVVGFHHRAMLPFIPRVTVR